MELAECQLSWLVLAEFCQRPMRCAPPIHAARVMRAAIPVTPQPMAAAVPANFEARWFTESDDDR